MRSRSKKSLRRKSWTSPSVSGPPMFSINIPVFGFLQKKKMQWLICNFLFSPLGYNLGSASKLTSNLFKAKVQTYRAVHWHPRATYPRTHEASGCTWSQLWLWPRSPSSMHDAGLLWAWNVPPLNGQSWTKIPFLGDWEPRYKSTIVLRLEQLFMWMPYEYTNDLVSPNVSFFINKTECPLSPQKVVLRIK